MSDNQLVLTGTLCKSPKMTQSPSGVTHCHLLLEHQSEQYEANRPRRAWLKMPVVLSGEQAAQQANVFAVGQMVRVWGFLSYHSARNGTGKLVLHAHSIERIN